MAESYARLAQHFSKLHRLHHAQSMLQWDAMVMAKRHGGPARAAALAEIEVLAHEASHADWIPAAVRDAHAAFGGSAEAASAAVDAVKEAKDKLPASHADVSPTVIAANVREMRRAIRRLRAVDGAVVERKSQLSSAAMQRWGADRAANNWDGFRPALEALVAACREEAAQLAPVVAEERGVKTVEPYEALAEQFDPGFDAASLARQFDELRQWLPDEISAARDRQKAFLDRHPDVAVAVKRLRTEARFPLERQEGFMRTLLPKLGFDFEAGRFDVIQGHPFCGGVPEDVRITSRLSTSDFVTGLMGVIHECGHALYEQRRAPRALIDQPVGAARSISIHESQSLFFEMQIGRATPFVAAFLAPQLQMVFPEEKEHLTADVIKYMYRCARPGKIRVDADELTYPLHVALRFDIERRLINGDLEVADVPAAWQEAMKSGLGIDLASEPESQYRDGCMQDMHWPSGAFGYFPTYTVGAAAAAQLMAAARRSIGDAAVDATLTVGEVKPLRDWLQANVWDNGCVPATSNELVRNATGDDLSFASYKAHLQKRAQDLEL